MQLFIQIHVQRGVFVKIVCNKSSRSVGARASSMQMMICNAIKIYS
jgi:hypothetical protein